MDIFDNKFKYATIVLGNDKIQGELDFIELIPGTTIAKITIEGIMYMTDMTNILLEEDNDDWLSI